MALTTHMRTVLIEHIDYNHMPVDIRHPRWLIVKLLLDREWLRFTDANRRFTIITERGRHELCVLLADYAEVMMAAGFDEAMGIKERLSGRRLARTKPVAGEPDVVVPAQDLSGLDKLV